PDDLGIYVDLFSEKLDLCCPFDQRSSKSSHRLIAYKKNGAFLSPEIMFQMMFDPSCIAHTAGGQDHFRFLVKVNGLGFVAGHRQLQPGESYRVDPLADQIHSLLVI